MKDCISLITFINSPCNQLKAKSEVKYYAEIVKETRSESFVKDAAQ